MGYIRKIDSCIAKALEQDPGKVRRFYSCSNDRVILQFVAQLCFISSDITDPYSRHPFSALQG